MFPEVEYKLSAKLDYGYAKIESYKNNKLNNVLNMTSTIAMSMLNIITGLA